MKFILIRNCKRKRVYRKCIERGYANLFKIDLIKIKSYTEEKRVFKKKFQIWIWLRLHVIMNTILYQRDLNNRNKFILIIEQ